MSIETKDQEQWLTRSQAARYLSKDGYHIEPQTLANLASNNNAGDGPRYTRSGWHTVRYRATDLDAWKKSRIHVVE